MKTYLGIDWGGTILKAGLVTEKGKILKKETFSSQELKEKTHFLNTIKCLVEKFSRYNLKGIGIGAPGIINIPRGFIYYFPNIPSWKNYPLKSVLEKKFNLPVFVDNDANAFALGEARVGVAKGVRRAVFLTLGTGLGGAVLWEGKILRGENSASELGHVPLTLNGKRCSCGAKGCIETFVGSRYLCARYRKLKKLKKSIEVKDIFERALLGEKEALIVWKEFSQSLGKFLAGMVNIFNPEVVVLGGGVSGAFKVFKPLLWHVIKHEVMWPHLKNLKLVKAKLKNAGIIGAAFLVKEGLN